MGRLDGKSAVIVGGSSGIGEAIAQKFAAEGAELLIAARGEEKLAKAAAALGAKSKVCDATSWDELKALAETALEHFGKLDIAVNCAGFEHSCPLAQIEPEDVEKMVAVQFTGALYFIQHMANAMAEHAKAPGGSIVNISSLTATLVAEGYAAYAGAKAGLNHASRIAASEYGGQGVRVNVVSPTVIRTPMTQHIFERPGADMAIRGETPLDRIGEIEDVVNVITFLASDEASFVTGENIHIDGGTALRRLPRTEDFVRAIMAAAKQDES
jgi:NAD(P)-dependent dehydrogenase (short-subunit alcohol dehydrogenase family)